MTYYHAQSLQGRAPNVFETYLRTSQFNVESGNLWCKYPYVLIIN